MKKTLLICLLGYLCVPISTSTAKVADSPPETDLVDYSGIPGQEGESSSAHMGKASPVIIYGELINPDSLGPIQLTVYPYGKRVGLGEDRHEITPLRGTFTDGVVDARVRKFLGKLEFTTDFAYLDLYLRDRPILKEYLVLPGDSIMISINLLTNQILFGGPSRQWFQAQFDIKREIATDRFNSPRVLVELDREQFLARSDNRSELQENETQFGSRLEILEQGKTAIDRSLSLLGKNTGEDIPGYQTLEQYRKSLNDNQYSLLMSELVSSYYAGYLGESRRYDLLVSRMRNDRQALERLGIVLPEILQHLKNQADKLDSTLPTAGLLNFLGEWAQTTALLSERSFLEVVTEVFENPLRERLLAEYVLATMNRQDDPLKYVDKFLPWISSNPWKDELESNQANFRLGVPLEKAQLTDLDGNSLAWDDLQGKPTLLYFYFSTCTHSARFFQEYLWPLYQELGVSKSLDLVAISIDNDQELWKESIAEYSNPTLTNLNLPIKDSKNWLDHYLILSFPRVFLLDSSGNLLSLRVREDTYGALKSTVLSLLESENKSISHL
ncbi:TlpA family protein disulfide reductase [Algoriphagus yeomjeoni]|uniref:Thioredoxin-like protein n=1 Tax=Algoriphagus yeomjeoni TaxID=291403 RepID=A0A327P3F9_9BACT|nr:thioredoxin family protein [Algoriphagus yeomjeoni]RAI85604.1 thioredoxin-like protein [Algoriphagus yeomjeoni]